MNRIDRQLPKAESLREELAFAEAAARAAGHAALSHYGTATAEMKEGNSPVTIADHASNDLIISRLREVFPDDAVLSEESPDVDTRLRTSRVWIIDPLDGTKEFLARNGEFSIMIGLVVDQEPVLGVVYLPDGDVLYSATMRNGAWVARNGTRHQLRAQPVDAAAIRMVGSRSHPDPLLDRMREALGTTDVVPSGSVGIKCSLIAEGKRDLYVHPVSYLKEWDTCAPEVVLRAAGGQVTDCRGQALRYNKAEPVQPDGIIATGVTESSDLVDRLSGIYLAARASS